MIKICRLFNKHDISKIRLYATQIKKEMKYLNVAEKNDAAKTIAGLLSNGASRRREGLSVYNKIYEFETTVRGSKSKMVMTSVSGHLMQLEFLLSYRNWKNCAPQQLFDAPVRKNCKEDFLAIKKTLEREIKSCQGLIIWTDCDREGENIGFEIINVCKDIKPNINVFRAKFSEITSAAVRRALANLAQPDKLQNDAVDVRTELDLRTGAAITRLQTMRLQRLFPEKIANKLISYGSCQIPTLGFVAERYKEVEAFISEPFWKIKVTHTIDELTIDFNWARNRLFDKEACEDYLMLCLADPKAKVESVITKPKNKWRPKPMDTVEMEKLGSRKLKLSAKETMTIAEKLYTQGIISYPRTETNMFSKEIDLKNLVELQIADSNWGDFARRVKEWGPDPRNGNKSDQAHPPIHPTKLVTSLTGNEARVYELIVRHFLACVSKDATGSETIVNIDVAGEKFTATGLCIYERNYLDVYIYEKWNTKLIHSYEIGQVFDPTEILMQEGATTAPPLLTEADLIALMEKHGIGTDATHAEHINTIKERGYIGEADRGCLVPGVIGMGLYEGYDAMELVLAKPMLRAEFEADLKEICLGRKDPKVVLQDQIKKYKEAYKVITEKIASMDEKMSLRINENPCANSASDQPSTNENQILELFDCPKCRVSPMGLRQKKNSSGYYIGCLNFPDCKNVVWLSDELKDISYTQENCRRCGASSKMLKFKFSAAYYRSLFNVPDGWYTTCLRCDNKFRETFNINADQVKRVGPIVSDTIVSTNRIANPNISIQNQRNGTRRIDIIASSSDSNTNSALTEPSAPDRNQTRAKKTKKPSKAGGSRSQQTSIRTFTTSSREFSEEPTRQVDDMDEFFKSDDGFDDVLVNAELDAETHQHLTSLVESNILSDELSSLFTNDDFEDYSWGTADRRNYRNQSPAPRRERIESEETYQCGPSSSTRYNHPSLIIRPEDRQPRLNVRIPSAGQSELNYRWGTSENEIDSIEESNVTRQCTTQAPVQRENTTVKCTGCHQVAKELTVKKNGPNKGRAFYSCPKSNACKFFQWVDENLEADGRFQPNPEIPETSSTRSLTDNELINCNCPKVAVSRIVRREGPNQGRWFYSCSNWTKACGFFKWADDQVEITRGFSNASSIAVNKPSTSGLTARSCQNETKKRKCGFCRQEGHTKVKCPRKAEFEI